MTRHEIVDFCFYHTMCNGIAQYIKNHFILYYEVYTELQGANVL